MKLGDLVESVLSNLGVNKAEVEAWIGKKCGCDERKERLNALGAWARHVTRSGTTKAKEYLHGLIR